MKVLVTGGAGYVGSAVCHGLARLGHNLIVIDNLLYGHKEALPREADLRVGDLLDRELLALLFEQNEIDAVLHFAAYTYVGESVENPQKYFSNNLLGALNLVEQMVEHNVKKIVFSSSAAVYGEPKKIPIPEETPLNPQNPYGETKVMIEKFLKWYDRAYGIKYVSLRYFNAAGADLKADIGEDHDPETHLIPLVMKVALGQQNHIDIYGTDYPTSDGTCIRDYIHIVDLADAHIRGLGNLEIGKSGIYNLGTGKGASVKEVIETCRKVTGKTIKAVETGRRPGDPAVLVASYEKAKKELGWEPKRNLEEIIKDAWEWTKKHPEGYRS